MYPRFSRHPLLFGSDTSTHSRQNKGPCSANSQSSSSICATISSGPVRWLDSSDNHIPSTLAARSWSGRLFHFRLPNGRGRSRYTLGFCAPTQIRLGNAAFNQDGISFAGERRGGWRD